MSMYPATINETIKFRRASLCTCQCRNTQCDTIPSPLRRVGTRASTSAHITKLNCTLEKQAGHCRHYASTIDQESDAQSEAARLPKRISSSWCAGQTCRRMNPIRHGNPGRMLACALARLTSSTAPSRRCSSCSVQTSVQRKKMTQQQQSKASASAARHMTQ